MPIYTYRCDHCGIQFDRHQSFTDPTLTRCPECNKKSLRKVFLPVGIVFKGSGFYATDHRSPSGASRTTSAEKAAAESKKTTELESTSSKTDKKSESDD